MAEIPKQVYDRISSAYTDEGCEIWWNSKNRNLHGQVPADMWRSGLRDPVIREAKRLDDAPYA